jgi:hypothetical protein
MLAVSAAGGLLDDREIVMDDTQESREAAWRAYTFDPALEEWKAGQRAFKLFCKRRRDEETAARADDREGSSR